MFFVYVFSFFLFLFSFFFFGRRRLLLSALFLLINFFPKLFPFLSQIILPFTSEMSLFKKKVKMTSLMDILKCHSHFSHVKRRKK